jgi:enterochelin esterase-like enzyme
MELYVQKLKDAKKQVETYLPDKGGHGFYVGREDGPEYREASKRSVEFFRQQMGQKAASAIGRPSQLEPREGTKPTLEQYGSLDWADSDRTAPPGTTYQTFHSKTINADVSYLVYLPPQYDKDLTVRYPVVYCLHASGGTPRRAAMGVVSRMDNATRAGRVPPLVMVFPNGLRGATMYCDTRDGKYPVESVLVRDLIPHIDATYRTVAGRRGRAVDGFSMGGFGAAHLGFKFPETFGVVSIQAPALLGPELKSPLPARAWSRLFPTAMEGDSDYFRANDPFALVVKNADALGDRSVIRIIAHDEDEHWLVPRCDELHRLLLEHGIAHQFLCLTNVKSHNPNQVNDTLGDAGLMFYSSAFHYLSGRPAEKTRGSATFDVRAVIKRVDADPGVVVFTAGGTERRAQAEKDVKVLDAESKPLEGGLRVPDLKEGAVVTLTIERQGARPIIKVIRLGSQGPKPPPANAKVATGVDTSKLVPLTDLGRDRYQGFQGGLYPEGDNRRPAHHDAAGLALAKQVQPLDADGQPATDGRIALLGIGFSNTVQVFDGFMQVASQDKDVNPKIVLVNGAMGGMSARMVQDPDDKESGTRYWSRVDEQLKAAGVTRAQVQVVWIKETDPVGQQQGEFPKYARDLQAELTRIVQVLRRRFANIKLVYLSSRTYGGWAKAPPGRAGGPCNSEPYSYETGFAVKWLIERQLQGDPALNYDPNRGAVTSPWLSWGPYLWANGETKRKDGFFFQPSDFRENDRMHHSPQGMIKVGTQMLRYFKSDGTTRAWFLQT